jgi:hypothetical protein
MRNSSNPPIVEDRLKFSIADLKRLGYFAPDAVVSGTLSWNNGQSTIRIKVDNISNVMWLDYVVDGGRHMKYRVAIIVRAANIGKGVIRYFECPRTYHLCRKLYLYGGMFVSRRAMSGAMYRSQTKSKLERAAHNGCLREDFVPYKRYGKLYYRGRLTPYGKRIKRYEDIVDRCSVRMMEWLFRRLHH